MITIECPMFLGGSKELHAELRIPLEKESVNTVADQLGVDGVFFANAPGELRPIERADGSKLHIASDEFDLLVDAYLDLEVRLANTVELLHYVTLRDGLLLIEANSTGSSSIVVDVSCALPREGFRKARTTVSRDGYVSEWRAIMGEIHRSLTKDRRNNECRP